MQKFFRSLVILLACASFAQENGLAYTSFIKIINQCNSWKEKGGPTKFDVWRMFDQAAIGCKPVVNDAGVDHVWTDPVPMYGETTVKVVSKVHHQERPDYQCAYTIAPEARITSPPFQAGDIVTCVSDRDWNACNCTKTGSM